MIILVGQVFSLCGASSVGVNLGFVLICGLHSYERIDIGVANYVRVICYLNLSLFSPMASSFPSAC